MDRSLKKSVKQFDETIEGLLVKCPEYEKENERLDETLVNENQKNKSSSLNSSEIIVDDRFKKITKKRIISIILLYLII